MRKNIINISLVCLAYFALTTDISYSQTLKMSKHPYISDFWQASYRYNCDDRVIQFSTSYQSGKIQITELEIGSPSTEENINLINDALSKIRYEKHLVTCNGESASILFNGWYIIDEELLGDSASVIVNSQGADQEKIDIRTN